MHLGKGKEKREEEENRKAIWILSPSKDILPTCPDMEFE